MLSENKLVRATGLTFILWFFLISRKTFLRGVPKTFQFTYKDKQFSLQLNSAIDIAVLVEIFVLKEYEWKLPFEVKNILDLGAHWGDSAIYYSLEYPGSKVFAVEPTPAEFARLQKLSNVFNIVPINGALGDVDGTSTLFVSKSSLGNSFSKRSETDSEIAIETFTMQKLGHLAGVEKFDLIKFDIEGAEKIIFADKNIKSLAKAFIGEIHLDLMDVSLEEVKNYFSDFNLSISELSKTRYIIKAVKNIQG